MGNENQENTGGLPAPIEQPVSTLTNEQLAEQLNQASAGGKQNADQPEATPESQVASEKTAREEEQKDINQNSQLIGELRNLAKMGNANQEFQAKQTAEIEALRQQVQANIGQRETPAEMALADALEDGDSKQIAAATKALNIESARAELQAEREQANNNVVAFNQQVADNETYVKQVVPNFEELIPVIKEIAKEDPSITAEDIKNFGANPYATHSSVLLAYSIKAQNKIIADGNKGTTPPPVEKPSGSMQQTINSSSGVNADDLPDFNAMDKESFEKYYKQVERQQKSKI